MDLTKAAGVLASRTVFGTTGLRSAGRALVRALGSDDETVRIMAGMSLVQAGKRSRPLLREALARRENVAAVLGVLADLGDPAAVPVLERYRDDPDPDVAQAARDALRVLRFQTEERPTPTQPPG